MIFKSLNIEGPKSIRLHKLEDDRGFFARSWCKKEFLENGIELEIKQSNISFNKKAGTVRGLHYQQDPFPEQKILRCVSGKIFVVMVDLRINSPTKYKTISRILDSTEFEMLYIPEYFALGFQTLEDNTEINYYMSEFYHQECSVGIRYDDPFLKISWPLKVNMISDRDKELEYLDIYKSEIEK